MSRINELMAEMCPHGVERKPLGEIAVLIRGNGMPKSEFTETGVGAIHYGQIYTRYRTSATQTLSFVSPESAARLAKVDPGDLIITNTSENLDDVGKAVAWLGGKQIVTGGHATVLKHSEDPLFLSYWFQTEDFSLQKKRLATGTKVMDVSAKQLSKVLVPIPPREIQQEISGILTTMEMLEAELEAELEARREQYAYYRDQLLTFPDAGGVRWVPLGDIGIIFGGLTGKSKMDFSNGNARFISYVNIFKNIEVDLGANDFVQVRDGERQRRLVRGDILFTGSSETAAEVGMTSVITQDVVEPVYLNSFSIGCRLNDPSILEPDFAKHLFRSRGMREQIVKTASGVTRFNVSKARLAKIEVPIPDTADQRIIAGVLDKFEALVNSLNEGLPAELAARRRQYEYYRDRLLTFDELNA